MEFSIRSGQNNKKIGPILAINTKDFNNQYVAEKLIKNLPKEYKKFQFKVL